MTAIRRVEAVIWPLIYGGMFLAVLGFALRLERAELGWAMVGLGAAAVVAGSVLIWVRSRMQEPAEPPTIPPEKRP